LRININYSDIWGLYRTKEITPYIKAFIYSQKPEGFEISSLNVSTCFQFMNGEGSRRVLITLLRACDKGKLNSYLSNNLIGNRKQLSDNRDLSKNKTTW